MRNKSHCDKQELSEIAVLWPEAKSLSTRLGREGTDLPSPSYRISLIPICLWLKIRQVRLVSVLENIPFPYYGRRAFALPISWNDLHLCARLRLSLQFRGYVNYKNFANCYND